MVGVSYLIIFIYLKSFVSSTEDCPRKICNCLGDIVDCEKNNFLNVPDNIPKWTRELNLNNNNIVSLRGDNWKNLTNLTELKLNKNNVVNITKDSLDNLKRLKFLEINRNHLVHIEALSFKSLEQLSVLKLKRNRIRQLTDGVFFGLKRIQSLILDYNYVQVIAKGWLYDLGKLKELSINNNRIHQIEMDAWEFCRDLGTLDLSSNKLKAIKRDTFKYLSMLKKLNLNSNNISYIEENAFSHVPNLKTLLLSSNKLSGVIEGGNGVFRSLASLQVFTLALNNIKSINTYAFEGLASLRQFDLSNNNITSVQKRAFNEMTSLEALQINTTMLLCDCHLRWFFDWLKSKRLEVHTICAYPKWLRNKSLLSIPPNNLTCDDQLKPRLTQEPDLEIMALKGGNISISCVAMSSSPSPMTFQWKKDNIDLTDAVVINRRIGQDGKNTEMESQLNISKVQQTDAGKYQCVVSNTFGTTYSQKSSITVLIYPKFEKIPQNVTVPAGDTAKLECAATGEPPPEIAWQKDGGTDFPAATERRMHVMFSDDVFFIVRAKPSDMGMYSCIAHNIAGTIVANATLVIQEKPYFVKEMLSKEVTEGESVVLQCMAGGSPKPSIVWLKDKNSIKTTERHFFTAEDQLMIIVDTHLSDSGTYICQLNNSLGQVMGYSQVTVKRAGITDSDMMGIIIITVVCCAVCTSIIWVVIIYQTRRKIPPPGTEMSQPEEIPSEYTERMNNFGDDASEHSSCKDSGTGDSAKRSNDDLLPGDEYTLIINGINPNDKNSTMRRVSLVYLVPEGNNSHTPLLHSDNLYPRSTNHDRLPSTSTTVDVEPNAVSIEPKG
ncbi:Immunoglobulin [Oryctes borbonicus]|uniref:Immunoglobulin n=1 Tax=Oryctes borbonicus TaxID=1629725 RepID=A0A0T6BC00_9SCAR|nr:Immunoglobulin [Oryctes borbonicus]